MEEVYTEAKKLQFNLNTVERDLSNNKVMGRTRTGFTEAYAQSLSANCDLDT